MHQPHKSYRKLFAERFIFHIRMGLCRELKTIMMSEMDQCCCRKIMIARTKACTDTVRRAGRRIIQKHLANIKKYMGQPVPGCSPTAAAS